MFKKQYEPLAFFDFKGNSRDIKKKESFNIILDPLKFKDGKAIIKIKVSDNSWRRYNKGNLNLLTKELIIDSKPPEIQILTRHHNIEPGGSGLVIYKLFEKNIKSGVKIKDNFFKGGNGIFKDDNIYIAFFALSHDQNNKTSFFVVAKDMAGNITKKSLNRYIRNKKFKNDVLNISDNFLNNKIPDFDLKEKNFETSKNPLLQKFIYINNKLRDENIKKVLDVSSKTENKKYWNKRFLRLKGSVQKAGFGDRRTYKHKDKKIDQAIHLGIDLASVANAPIKASNTGKILFARPLGIFGNTVIIDHGFGLKSLYGHLSQIIVEEGELVQKGKTIGLTGLTGLAGGDHLHFSMLVHNVFVNPLEWWDSSWIENNIIAKINRVKSMYSQ